MTYTKKKKFDASSFPDTPCFGFSGYRIVDGSIRPRRGAQLEEYDPWLWYRETMNHRRTVETPYSEFLDLGRRLKPVRDKGSFNQLGPELETAMTNWCAQFGSLGLLASTAVEILLPAVTVTDRRGRESLKQQRYYRTGGRWGLQETQPPPEKTPAPYVIFWRWYAREWQVEKLHKIARFFPEFKDPQRQYPHFDSPEFKRFYVEPVPDFVRTCVSFFETALVVSNHLRGVSPLLPGMSKDHVHFALDESIAHLDSLKQAVGPSYTLSSGKLTLRNESASLIGSFAEMLFFDLARGRRVISCALCEKIFVSNEPRARFCSATCRKTEASRRYRREHGATPRKRSR